MVRLVYIYNLFITIYLSAFVSCFRILSHLNLFSNIDWLHLCLWHLIVVGGWYDVAWTYINCLLVGFMWVRTSRSWLRLNLLPLCKVTSRNVSSVSLMSYVNLIVWWIWLMVFIYVVNSDADPVQTTNLKCHHNEPFPYHYAGLAQPVRLGWLWPYHFLCLSFKELATYFN